VANLLWLDQIQPADCSLVGNKALCLSQVFQQGLPVVSGFVIPNPVLREFLAGIDWTEPLFSDLPDSSLRLDIDNPMQLQRIAQQIRQMITQQPLPATLLETLQPALTCLQAPMVILRPSLFVELKGGDAARTRSVANGRTSALFNAQVCTATLTDLERGLKTLWAELFAARSLFYWQRCGILQHQVRLAILVQPLRSAIAAGVVRRSDRWFQIQSTFGLGLAISQGEVMPDLTWIQAESGTLLKRHLGCKTIAYHLRSATAEMELQRSPSPLALPAVPLSTPTAPGAQPAPDPDSLLPGIVPAVATGVTLQVQMLSVEQQQAHSLDDRLLAELFPLMRQVCGEQQPFVEMEWMLCTVNAVGHRLYVTQVVPESFAIAGIGDESDKLFIPLGSTPVVGDSPILIGLGAAPGRAIGKARVLTQPGDLVAPLEPGTILVVPDLSPHWVPQIKQAAGMITERGGLTSHGAIVARELGIPAVIAAMNATRQIESGTWILLDGNAGEVYRVDAPAIAAMSPAPPQVEDPEPPLPTIGTRLMVNLSQPEALERVVRLPVDGIGLLRSELLFLTILDRQHPHRWLQLGRSQELVDRLVDALSKFTHAMQPRPILYRSLDLRSHEFRGLLGGEKIPLEVNPMLGMRGTFSYRLNPQLFDLELRALARVQQQGGQNLHLVLPFVRTVEEFQFCRDRVKQAGLLDHPQFQLWIMAEVPSILFLLPEYVRAGVQGISIGSNDLTQLLLGVDRDQAQLATAFDASQPAVQAAIAQLIQQSRHLGIPCSLCGQAAVDHPHLIDDWIRWGMTAISVEPAAVQTTYQAIARAERRLLTETARSSDP